MALPARANIFRPKGREKAVFFASIMSNIISSMTTNLKASVAERESPNILGLALIRWMSDFEQCVSNLKQNILSIGHSDIFKIFNDQNVGPMRTQLCLASYGMSIEVPINYLGSFVSDPLDFRVTKRKTVSETVAEEDWQPMFITSYKPKRSLMDPGMVIFAEMAGVKEPIPINKMLTPEYLNKHLCGHKGCPGARKFKEYGLGPLATNGSSLGTISSVKYAKRLHGMSQAYGTMANYGAYGLFIQKQKEPKSCCGSPDCSYTTHGKKADEKLPTTKALGKPVKEILFKNSNSSTSSNTDSNTPIPPGISSAVENNSSIVPVSSTGSSKTGPIESKPERKVLVLYTGGTIGMIRNENGVLAPVKNMLKQKIKTYPELHDVDYAAKRFGKDDIQDYLVLPPTALDPRILYTIEEYDQLLDSSNMSMNEWIKIANDIKRSYQIYDGFVILHGTDTLTYTASALSFMLENLGKTVVVTGSQIPIFESRSDGKDNFYSAILFAGGYIIQEVTVFFGNELFRGNRTIKVSTASFHAFHSPNIPPLATVGINIKVDYKNIFRPTNIEKFSVHTKLNQNVGLLRIFPSITKEIVHLFLQPPIQGVVLQTYGAGNIPSNRADMVQELKEATSKGVIIVNCTQCAQGPVQGIYETGQILNDAGVISGMDMTPETALSKLSYVLAKDDWDAKKKREMLSKNIRGELTESFHELSELDLVGAVATTLNLTSPEDLYNLRNVLCPAMLMSGVSEKSITKLKMLKSLGVDMSAPNTDKRTALHAACADGNLEIVDFLLRNGCSVHARDRYDRTPLHDAIENNHHQVIRLMITCGAHLIGSPRLIGEQLCLAAASGSIINLQSYQISGANMSQADSCGRTALHVASLHNHEDVVKYLLSQGCDPYVKDMTGLTPVFLAEYRHYNNIVQLLTNSNIK